MEIAGIQNTFITLHCGLGNFNDIEVEDLTKHKMDSEQMEITKETCEKVNKAKLAGHRICAVGTSVTKATETAVGTDGMLKPYEGWTNKFIFPPYDCTVCDSMVSNFHMSKLGPNANKNSEDDGPAMTESVMLMMVAAFGGYENVMNAYDVAIKEKYMFGAYGDAMLIID